MHIYFIGDKASENRIEHVAQEVVKNGHTATIANVQSNTLISCIHALFINMDTIHVHGWMPGIFMSFLSIFLKHTTKIWTISTLPDTSSPFLSIIFRTFFAHITKKYTAIYTPSRTIQYRLLALYSLKTTYIPDGYFSPNLPDIRPAVYGLRKEQYGVILTENAEQLQQVAKMYKAFKTNKKIVVFSKRTHSMFNNIDVPHSSRAATSLIRQAAFVLVTDPAYTPLALQAMDTGRTIIASTNPLLEEPLGTTATYFADADTLQLQSLMHNAIHTRVRNTSAQTRANNHFTWNKIAQEYIRAYKHKKTVLVPFDSLSAPNSFQIAK